jgi:hypothetical protein
MVCKRAAARLAICSADCFRPRWDADILARLSVVCVFPLFAAASFSRCSGLFGQDLPRLASRIRSIASAFSSGVRSAIRRFAAPDIRARVSGENDLRRPRFATAIASTAASTLCGVGKRAAIVRAIWSGVLFFPVFAAEIRAAPREWPV